MRQCDECKIPWVISIVNAKNPICPPCALGIKQDRNIVLCLKDENKLDFEK